MRPIRRPLTAAYLWTGLALASAACTDWNAEGRGGPWLQGASPSEGSDAGTAAGLTVWDTWKAPDAGPNAGQNTGPDATPDASGADIGTDAGATDAGLSQDATRRVAPDAADVAPSDATPSDATPSDAESAEVEDGSAAYSLDGKGDFVGWPELPPAVSPSDAGVGQDSESDGEGDAPADVEGDGSSDGQADTELDAEGDGQGDAPADVEADGSSDGQADTELDAQADIPSDGALDALVDASPDAAADGAGDALADAASLPDGAMAPDWQGYPDLPYSADADIYGGAIGSCLSLYLYQQEFCGVNNPSAACINSVGKDASLYAQFQFEPLRDCQTAVCTDLCAVASDKTCMESCVVDYCAAPFLACTSNGAQGTQTCAEAWKCAKQYPDKLLTISAKCYAAASPVAQQQFSAVLGCTGPLQSQPCISEVAACFANPAAPAQSCSNTLTCMNGCNNDEICSFTCLGQANAQAVALIDAIRACQLSVCPPKCAGSSDPACGDECLKNECQSQLVQCLVN